MCPGLSSLSIGRMRCWGQMLADLCSLDVQIVIWGLRDFGRDLLLHFFLVARRNQASSGTGAGDSPQRPWNTLDLPCDKTHCSSLTAR